MSSAEQSRKAHKRPRPRIPEEIVSRVLIECRRRCALCAHFNNDHSQKEGQIAHIDRDRDNNREDNLAFLCQPHHDQYDARRSQTRALTKRELVVAKEQLLEALQRTSADRRDDNQSPTRYVPIDLIIGGDFESYGREDQEQLISAIHSLLRTRGKITIIKKSRGSIHITLALPSDDALALLAAVGNGALDAEGYAPSFCQLRKALGVSIDQILIEFTARYPHLRGALEKALGGVTASGVEASTSPESLHSTWTLPPEDWLPEPEGSDEADDPPDRSRPPRHPSV